MVCCGRNKDDMEDVDVVHDLEAGYKTSEDAGLAQKAAKWFLSWNRPIYNIIGALGLLVVAVVVTTVLYRRHRTSTNGTIEPIPIARLSFEQRMTDVEAEFGRVKRKAIQLRDELKGVLTLESENKTMLNEEGDKLDKLFGTLNDTLEAMRTVTFKPPTDERKGSRVNDDGKEEE
eukprot:1005244_1